MPLKIDLFHLFSLCFTMVRAGASLDVLQTEFYNFLRERDILMNERGDKIERPLLLWCQSRVEGTVPSLALFPLT